MGKSWVVPVGLVMVTVLASALILAGPAADAEDLADSGRQMPANQSIACVFKARVVGIKEIGELAEIWGYVIDAEPRWELTLEVLTHANKIPFQPGIRHCYIADPAAVFGVPAEKVWGFHEFSYTWNIEVEGKPEFEAFKARPLTPAERGVLRVQADIEAGTPKILYYGEPRLAGKAMIDDKTGLPVEVTAGCCVTEDQRLEWDAYNTTVETAFNQTGGWGEASGGLQLRIWTAKRTYNVGEQIEVNFIFKNVSPSPLTLLDSADAHHCLMHHFTFTDADGKAIAFTSPELVFKEGPMTTSDKIAPDACFRHTVVLNHWKLAGLGHPHTEIGKEARTIVVTGTYTTPVGDRMEKTVWQGSVTSKPIQIEIVE